MTESLDETEVVDQQITKEVQHEPKLPDVTKLCMPVDYPKSERQQQEVARLKRKMEERLDEIDVDEQLRRMGEQGALQRLYDVMLPIAKKRFATMARKSDAKLKNSGESPSSDEDNDSEEEEDPLSAQEHSCLFCGIGISVAHDWCLACDELRMELMG